MSSYIHKTLILSIIAFMVIIYAACSGKAQQTKETGFVTVEGTNIVYQGKPLYYIGTNFWGAPILASTGAGGNRERLHKELDTLKALGVENLRILVGADAGSSNANSVRPYLQPRPGIINDTLLVGLDYTLAELEKRGMTAVLYLTNSWDWSGGFGFYLRECGYGDSPNASGEGYNDYVKYSSDFMRDEQAKELYYNHVRTIVSRRNSITGRDYKDEPSIMSWQICNEPRPFAKDNKEAFAQWISKTAQIIKSIDGNHLVSTGSEGLYGCEVDEQLCERIHNDPNIDYLTIHIWPLNWGWASRTEPDSGIDNACKRAGEYIDLHVAMSKRINKPLVIEEFGYARRDNKYTLDADVESRDKFYRYIFENITKSASENGVIAGCNFWGWGGMGRPADTVWNEGDDLLCDPPHEPQGWYSVFDIDSSTTTLIKEKTTILNNR